MSTLYENRHLWHFTEFFLEWEIFQTNVVEKIKTHFIFNNFFPENRAVYDIGSKNVVELEEPQMTSQYGAYALNAG